LHGNDVQAIVVPARDDLARLVLAVAAGEIVVGDERNRDRGGRELIEDLAEPRFSGANRRAVLVVEDLLETPAERLADPGGDSFIPAAVTEEDIHGSLGAARK